MPSYNYPAIIECGSEGSYIVRFPDLPEALTFGTTVADAAHAAVDCLREALRGRIRDMEPIPAPSQDVPDAHIIAPPAEMAAKAAVYDAFRRGNVTRVALAGKLKVDESEIRRILDPAHRTKLDRLEQAAKALGGRLEVSFVPFA
jgi:antitoxin HicB